MKVCSACGKQWNDETRFCSEDGQPLTDLPTEIKDPLIGKLLNRTYRIEAKLGQGGMGTVYRGRHIGIGDIVAIKLISPEQTQNSDILKRFRREAQVVRRLSHPNAVAVHDFNVTEDGLLFMVMEYVDGITLEQYLKEQSPLPPARALEILMPITAALDAAHNLGIIHRDLKPANLMLCKDTAGREQVKVLDFGTARISQPGDEDPYRSSASVITHSGQLFGTPKYMSPEQAAEETITGAADIYSLGVVLYQMLTGNVPFEGKNIIALLRHHLDTPPEPPSKRCADLNEEIDNVVLKALEKKPENRYPTAKALAKALSAAVSTVAKEHQYITRAIDSVPSFSSKEVGELALPRADFHQFVKREQELKQLQNEYINACERRMRPSFIIGSAGMGKSELLGQFRDWASKEGAVVLSGKFFDYGSSPNQLLQTFKNMLALTVSAAGAEADNRIDAKSIDERLSEQFGLSNAPEEGSDVNKWQVFEQLNAAFAKLAGTRPLVLLMDDLHWADSISLEYLGFLLRSVRPYPFCFVGTMRAEDAESQGQPLREWLKTLTYYCPYESIELAPFDCAAINEWLQSVFRGIEIGQHDINLLFKITDGNPFYLGEVVRLLIETGKIAVRDGRWHCQEIDEVKVPASINNIVKYKLEKCPDKLFQLLSQAAVIGDGFGFELLKLVSGLGEEEMAKLLGVAKKFFLLREVDKSGAQDNYRFYQTIIRLVIYEEIPRRQRRRLHLQVASALIELYQNRTTSVMGALTYHYHAAGAWEETFKYGMPAIEQALQQQVMDEVIRLSDCVEEALSNFEEESSSEKQTSLGQVKLRRLMALTRLARFEEAGREAKEIHDFIKSLKDPALYLTLQGIVTELNYWGYRYNEGVATGSAGLALARRVNNEAAACHLLFYLAMCQSRISQLAEAISTFEELHNIAEQHGNRSMQAAALGGIGFFSHFIGRWQRSREYLEKSVAVARACNDRYYECLNLIFSAWVKEYECNAAKLEKLCEEGKQVAHICGWRNLEGYFYFVAGRSSGSALNPDFKRTREILSQGMAIMQQTGDLTGQLFMAHASAIAEGRANPSPESLAKLAGVADILTKKGEVLNNCRTQCEQADVLLKLGKWDEALTTFQNGLQLAESIPFVDCLWRAHFGLGRCFEKMGERDTALHHLSLAVAVIESLKNEFNRPEEQAAFLADKQPVFAAHDRLLN